MMKLLLCFTVFSSLALLNDGFAIKNGIKYHNNQLKLTRLNLFGKKTVVAEVVQNTVETGKKTKIVQAVTGKQVVTGATATSAAASVAVAGTATKSAAVAGTAAKSAAVAGTAAKSAAVAGTAAKSAAVAGTAAKSAAVAGTAVKSAAVAGTAATSTAACTTGGLCAGLASLKLKFINIFSGLIGIRSLIYSSTYLLTYLSREQL